MDNRSVGMGIGIFFWLLSLPAAWLDAAPNTALPAGWTPITGLNGLVNLGPLQVPIWLIGTLGVLALALSFSNLRQITGLPRWALWTPLTVTLCLLGDIFVIGLSNDHLRFGIGVWLGVAGTVIGGLAGMPALLPQRGPGR